MVSLAFSFSLEASGRIEGFSNAMDFFPSRVALAPLCAEVPESRGWYRPLLPTTPCTIASGDAVGPTRKDCSAALCWDALIFTWHYCAAINPTQGP